MAQIKKKKGLKRDTLDKFYTKASVVEFCQFLVEDQLSIAAADLLIEPSAGNGAFLPLFNHFSPNYHLYDLEPDHPSILQQDYLTLDIEPYILSTRKIHVIGNPPFGRQSSLAIKFIKKSCKFCHSLAFILPKSFKKDSLKKNFPLSFHLLSETDVPEKAFLVDGHEYNVPCVFQIWEKRAEMRPYIAKLEPIKFRFVQQTEEPDISFRRVGVNAGAIDTHNLSEKSKQSHYFIQFTQGVLNEDTIPTLQAIQFVNNNTVGPRSISKQELIKEFIKVL
jgi:hypothetical protein